MHSWPGGSRCRRRGRSCSLPARRSACVCRRLSTMASPRRTSAHARREELEGRHGLVRPPRDDARGRRGRPAGPRPPDARDRRADLEALLRREGRQLAARQVPAEGGARADGARGLHSSEVRGQPEPVPCREVEADRGRARPRGLPGVRAPLPPGDRGRQRVSRAAGQAVHPMEAAGDAAARSGPDASQEVIVAGGEPDPSGQGGLRAALAASALVHGLAILLVARVASGPSRPPLVAFSVSLIAGTGSSGDAAAPGPAETPAAFDAAPLPTPTPRRRPARRREPSRTATGEGSASSRGQGVVPGNGAGDAGGAGGGGDGAGGTGAAYGANPLPPYPLVARRLGMEGVVLLEVVVAPDGHAAEVRVARSSGYPALDESALTTVRERWRFIPAHRDGVPVESRVTVPIRFRLEA
ncbi:MAG: energy transducer TonB [Deltaproteobacteria bacterium]|nr:MAG: energy transducer TonB [Deltaproteobacteria bacterium]